MPPVASPDTTCCTKVSNAVLLVPEIGAADRVVLAEDLRRTLHDDAPGFEQEDVVGEVERERRVLLDEQDADAGLRVHRAEDLEDLAHDHRREAERRLVEQE